MKGFEDVQDQTEESAPAEDSSNEMPITEEGAPEQIGETIRVPVDFLHGQRFKAGDEIKLKVVSSDDDGIEVSYSMTDSDEKPGHPSADEEIDNIPSDY